MNALHFDARDKQVTEQGDVERGAVRGRSGRFFAEPPIPAFPRNPPSNKGNETKQFDEAGRSLCGVEDVTSRHEKQGTSRAKAQSYSHERRKPVGSRNNAKIWHTSDLSQPHQTIIQKLPHGFSDPSFHSSTRKTMYSDQDEFETHRCRGGLSPTTHYHPGVIDHRPTVGLAPEELLVLPASFRYVRGWAPGFVIYQQHRPHVFERNMITACHHGRLHWGSLAAWSLGTFNIDSRE